jgi:hypothetical protein
VLKTKKLHFQAIIYIFFKKLKNKKRTKKFEKIMIKKFFLKMRQTLKK